MRGPASLWKVRCIRAAIAQTGNPAAIRGTWARATRGTGSQCAFWLNNSSASYTSILYNTFAPAPEQVDRDAGAERQALALPLGITAAMHVEGGPEASLSIHAGGLDLDLNGSYETGFNENDDEKAQWPIPNLLAVVRR